MINITDKNGRLSIAARGRETEALAGSVARLAFRNHREIPHANAIGYTWCVNIYELGMRVVAARGLKSGGERGGEKRTRACIIQRTIFEGTYKRAIFKNENNPLMRCRYTRVHGACMVKEIGERGRGWTFKTNWNFMGLAEWTRIFIVRDALFITLSRVHSPSPLSWVDGVARVLLGNRFRSLTWNRKTFARLVSIENWKLYSRKIAFDVDVDALKLLNFCVTIKIVNCRIYNIFYLFLFVRVTWNCLSLINIKITQLQRVLKKSVCEYSNTLASECTRDWYATTYPSHEYKVAGFPVNFRAIHYSSIYCSIWAWIRENKDVIILNEFPSFSPAFILKVYTPSVN